MLSSMSSGLLVTSRCILSLSPALSCLDVIKYYYLSLCPRLRVPVPPSCVHRDRRPDQTVSGVPSPRFVLFVFSSGYFVPVFCPSRQASPRALMPAVRGSLCRRSRLSHPTVRGSSREFTPPFAAQPSRRSREFTPPFVAQRFRHSREFTPPFAAHRARRSREFTPPFAAHRARCSREFTPPFPAHRARRSQEMTPPSTANRPAADSMPAGLPLPQCPPACL